ncbi:hypothetical protein [Sorangium cellulosum]|nr:hypothetical protein [Sorangium cellulosum]
MAQHVPSNHRHIQRACHGASGTRAIQGYIDTANDLVAFSALFTASWSEVTGRTAATEEEVRRAGEIGPQILAPLGVREHDKSPGPTEAADRRARAFSLLVHAYDQTRRAIAYLRWDKGTPIRSRRPSTRAALAERRRPATPPPHRRTWPRLGRRRRRRPPR